MLKDKHKFIFALWKNYIIFIMFPAIVITLTTIYIADILQKKTVKQNLSMSDQAISAIKMEFENMNKIAISVLQQPQIQRLSQFEKEVTSEYFYEIWSAKNIFEQYRNIFDSGNFFLYLDKNDIVLSSNSLCTDFKKYYGEQFRFDDLEYEEFVNLQSGNDFIPYNEINIGSDRFKGIIYHYRFSLPSPITQGYASLFLILNYKYIDSVLLPLSDNYTEIYIFNKSNDLVYTSNKDGGARIFESKDYTELNKDYVVSYNHSQAGLTYLCLTPKNIVLKDVRILNIFVFIFISLAVIIALAVSCVVCIKNSRFLYEIFYKMTDLNNRSNIFQVINYAFFDMIYDNNELRTSIIVTRKILQKEFFTKLITGDFHNLHDLQIYAEDAQIIFENQYEILALSVDLKKDIVLDEDLNELKTWITQIYNTLEYEVGNKGYVIRYGIERIVILITSSLIENQDIYFQDLISKLSCIKDFPVDLTASSNFQASSILELKKVCYQCIYMLNLIKGEETHIVKSIDKEIKKEYTISVEHKNNFLLSIQNGNFDVAEDIFSQDYYDVVYYNDINNYSKRNFISQLKNTLMISSNDLTLYSDDAISNMNDLSMGKTLYKYLICRIRKHCEDNVIKSKGIPDNLNNDFKFKVVQYIAENISSQTLSLKSIADDFGFSSSYFSTIFKEYMDINFSSYVEEKRMEYAKDLILNKNCKIEEIAHKCGYSNTNVFRRSYKKFFGVNPSKTTDLYKNI